MNSSFMQSPMTTTHQQLTHQVATNPPTSQQTVQFQPLTPYNATIIHQNNPIITTPVAKPPVGSDEWLKQRRANHKEVERRRRENINEGINNLAKLIPGEEKNKGRILAKAVQYIQQLKKQESDTLEKWTLEKLLCEQAITEYSLQVETLKHQNSQLKAQLAALTQQQQQQQQQQQSKEEISSTNINTINTTSSNNTSNTNNNVNTNENITNTTNANSATTETKKL